MCMHILQAYVKVYLRRGICVCKQNCVVCIFMWIYIYISMHICIHTQEDRHTCTHTHTHTHDVTLPEKQRSWNFLMTVLSPEHIFCASCLPMTFHRFKIKPEQSPGWLIVEGYDFSGLFRWCVLLCVYIYIVSTIVPNEFFIWMNPYELTRISWYGIQCFVSWLKSRLQHPLGHQLLVPSRVDSTNAAEGALSAGWSRNPSGCGLLHDISMSSWGSIASGSWAGVFWNRQKKSDIIIHRCLFIQKHILKLSKPSLLNFQRHFPGEHWATPSHRGWVWHITRTWGVPSDFQESHQGVWYYLLIFAVLGKMRGFPKIVDFP